METREVGLSGVVACGYEVIDRMFGRVQYVVGKRENGRGDGVYIPEDASG